MNDVIKSGYTPKYLSVLKKRKRDDFEFRKKDKYGIGHLADICASRILNFFECPTTYETLLDIDGEVFCCSVDFNNPNEDFYNLQGLNRVYGYYGKNDLIESLEDIESSLIAFKNHQLNEKYDSKRGISKDVSAFDLFDKFVEDYVYSWLIRVIVLCDSDYRFYNLGLIHNTKDNTFRISPNFDLEYCFDNIKENAWTCSNMNNLQFIASRYPKVYKKFVDKLELLVSKEKGKSRGRKIIESVIGNDEKAKPFIVDFRKHLRDLYNLITEFAPVRESNF